MNTYTFVTDKLSQLVNLVRKENLSIPLDMQNRDCIKFLTDWKAGAEVLNADGSPAPYSDAAVRALGLEPITGETP